MQINLNLNNIKLQNLIPINDNSFQRKPRFIATPYVLHQYVFQTVLISEQIEENRCGSLLGISDKLITKFNAFRYMGFAFQA